MENPNRKKKITELHANPLYYQRYYKRRGNNLSFTLYLQWHTHT